jgi:hypothetical protein
MEKRDSLVVFGVFYGANAEHDLVSNVEERTAMIGDAQEHVHVFGYCEDVIH